MNSTVHGRGRCVQSSIQNEALVEHGIESEMVQKMNAQHSVKSEVVWNITCTTG